MIKLDPIDNPNIRYEFRMLQKEDGEQIGWEVLERRTYGAYSVFRFNEKGILTDYKEYSLNNLCLEPELFEEEEIRCDEEGKMVSWTRYDYLPEDGMGWDYYRTELDVNGNVIDTDWHGAT